ncbi:Uncharacterised protein [Vibrio cholerae]|nr:Uncharacterised protein [Vibrio cholerae]CRZ92849.1 Uncharacterised protein [Vibrio cholerae]CSB02523.1 Uncharacterised protein [Vibrio cholerae]CSB38930.1 Uncharacterised protein [Vibrio cholerae]CSB51165.1 Uncharacterised protein [Vibrio cholerae]
MRQKRILLRFIKAMDFVDKQNSASTTEFVLTRFFDRGTDLFDSGRHRRYAFHFRIGVVGCHFG